MLLATAALAADDPIAGYRAAREALPDANRVVVCENITLKRPGATFILKSGQLAFMPKLAGKSWAAVYSGSGILQVSSPEGPERQQLRRFTKKDALEEPFSDAIFYFCDNTEEEVLKGGREAPNTVSAHTNVLKWARDQYREKLRTNIEASVLRHILRGEGQFFSTLVKTSNFGTVFYEFAPFDAEEITLLRLRADDTELWNSYPLSFIKDTAGRTALPKDTVDTTTIKLDTRIDGGTTLTGDAEVEFKALNAKDRLIRVQLAYSLRVKSVTDDAGQALPFIQEHEKRDAALWILTPAALEKGKTYKWKFQYAGKDVIGKEGNGNFYVGARSAWFPRPAVPGLDFGDRARFQMTFHIPKAFKLVATGKELQRKTDGKEELTEWDSVIPATVAGFNYGRFSIKEREGNGFKASVYVNPGTLDELTEIKLMLESSPQLAAQLGISPSGLTTTGMSDAAAAEGLNCMTFYTQLFGAIPEKHLRITQQPSSSFGQSWPGLVFMPYTAFLDGTTRNQLKLDRGSMRNFLAEVGPHEIAHQWWGHAVVWKDYRDQWLSEGFAEYSAALFLQATKGTKAFAQFLKNQKESITSRINTKIAPNDAGPIWLGPRLGAEDSPYASQLIYSKGAYVLHMIRMRMHDYRRNSDAAFLEMMRSFVKEFADRPVTTEDFEIHVSKHMNRNMVQFFDQWVRGTGYPKVRGGYTIEQKGEGFEFILDPKVENVPEGFIVEVPVSLKFDTGAVVVGWFSVSAPGEKVSVKLPKAPTEVEFVPQMELLGDVDIRRK